MSKKKKDQVSETEVEKVESTTAESTATEPTADQIQTGLNVGDLKKMVQIIQTCSKRGAFNADELQIVGQTYTNLVSFLVSTGAIKDPAKQETPGEPVPEAQPETPAEETTVMDSLPSDVEPTKE
tara:strand:- start:523 stop:897 length:375 start_codon:yes stop_codon:yes gene_type:complete